MTGLDPRNALLIPGCSVQDAFLHKDSRGSFRKVFTTAAPDPDLSCFSVAECFVNVSRRGVVRGMHVQLPPAEHRKIVCCIAGSAFDVLLDLRADSPLFGRPVTLALDASSPISVLLPPGVAHGFQSLEDSTSMLYLTSSAHRADLDSGVRWNSCGIDWPLPVCEVSERDQRLPAMADFSSPFKFGK